MRPNARPRAGGFPKDDLRFTLRLMRLPAAIALVALFLAACSSSGGSHPSGSSPASAPSSASGATFIAQGQFSIMGEGSTLFTVSGSSCAGTGKASSLVPGAPVKVTDLQGHVLASGQLSDGSTNSRGQVGEIGSCVFTFAVAGIPDGQTFYRLQFGSMRPEQLSSGAMHKRITRTFLG